MCGKNSALRPIALSEVPVRKIEARDGLLYVNDKPMVLDSLWGNGTAPQAYWLWEAWRDSAGERD